jgi:hypothetical protein
MFSKYFLPILTYKVAVKPATDYELPARHSSARVASPAEKPAVAAQQAVRSVAAAVPVQQLLACAVAPAVEGERTVGAAAGPGPLHPHGGCGHRIHIFLLEMKQG